MEPEQLLIQFDDDGESQDKRTASIQPSPSKRQQPVLDSADILFGDASGDNETPGSQKDVFNALAGLTFSSHNMEGSSSNLMDNVQEDILLGEPQTTVNDPFGNEPGLTQSEPPSTTSGGNQSLLPYSGHSTDLVQPSLDIICGQPSNMVGNPSPNAGDKANAIKTPLVPQISQLSMMDMDNGLYSGAVPSVGNASGQINTTLMGPSANQPVTTGGTSNSSPFSIISKSGPISPMVQSSFSPSERQSGAIDASQSQIDTHASIIARESMEHNEESNGFKQPVGSVAISKQSFGSNERISSDSAVNSHQTDQSQQAAAATVFPIARSRLNALPPPLEPQLFSLPTRRWTDPTTFADIPYTDRLHDAITKVFAGIPEAQRPPRKRITADKAITTPDPYKLLLETRNWRPLAQLCRSDIISCHPTEVDNISRLWLLRWYSLARLKLVDTIVAEASRLGDLDSSDLVFEKFPEAWSGRTGPLASFELRLFVAKIPAMKGNHAESIHRLYKLLNSCRKAMLFSLPSNNNANSLAEIDSAVMAEWHQKQSVIFMTIANVFIQIQDYNMALAVLKPLSVQFSSNPDLLSVLGRLHLHLGCLPMAKKVFTDVETMLGVPETSASESTTKPGGSSILSERQSSVASLRVSTQDNGAPSTSVVPKSTISTALPPDVQRPELILSNRAFLFFAEGEFKAAVNCLSDAVTRVSDFRKGVNNMALCHLYMGNVNQASSFLESVAVESPSIVVTMHEVIFNLCTIYDLTEHSLEKKRKLIKNVISQYAGDDFATENLKI